MKYEYNRMLTNGKMARELGIDPKTLRSWARKGVVRAYVNPANGYSYYFRREVLQALKKHPVVPVRTVDSRRFRR